MEPRHTALHPLSHHHHHALVAALKLKRAGTSKSQLTVDEVKKDLRAFWEPGGQEHFREEEEILLPEFSRYAAIDRPVIIEMLLEHVQIRALIAEVLEADDNRELVEKMNRLGEMLEKHVRKEERVIFPMIEQALPEEAFQKIAPYLHGNYES